MLGLRSICFLQQEDLDKPKNTAKVGREDEAADELLKLIEDDDVKAALDKAFGEDELTEIMDKIFGEDASRDLKRAKKMHFSDLVKSLASDVLSL